ncbi:MAG: cytochrome c, partial [Bacteroidetes bacterium]|nr:cytochrome c [Bacteroidota bacterium]
MKIVHSISFITDIFLFSSLFPVVAQQTGEAVFKETCVACHTIGQGKLVGPDLANIQNRHSEVWLINFIKSSQTVIKSG